MHCVHKGPKLLPDGWSLVDMKGTLDLLNLIKTIIQVSHSKAVKENSLLFVSGPSFLLLVKYNITSNHTEAPEHYTTTLDTI